MTVSAMLEGCHADVVAFEGSRKWDMHDYTTSQKHDVPGELLKAE